MKLINNILVAIDFRASSENIISNTIEFAKRFNARLSFIHVLPKEIENEKVSALAREAIEEQLVQVKERAESEGVEVAKPILKFGDYSERIVFTAEEVGASLIVIGSGEKKKGDRFRLGTTAGKIMRKSTVPVFVLKSNQNLNVICNVLCAVDFSKESNNALNNAIAIARLFESKLNILSVYTPFYQTISRIDPKEVNRQRKAEKQLELDEFLEGYNLIDLDYNKEIKEGDPAKEIINTIREKDIDLLLMGTTGKSAINKILMGSVAEKVTREALCSFITSKKEDFLTFEVRAKDLEGYYSAAEEFYKEGFYDQAIGLYKAALELNFSHVPSMNGLMRVYMKLGNEGKVDEYRGMIQNIMEQFQNFKIEEEIRRA